MSVHNKANNTVNSVANIKLKNPIAEIEEKGQQENASKVEILSAALIGIAEQYNEKQTQIIDLLERLEKSVKESNEQKALDVKTTLEKAVDDIMKPMESKFANASKVVDKVETIVTRLESVEKAIKESNERKELNIKNALENAVNDIFNSVQRKATDVVKAMEQAESKAEDIYNEAIDWRKWVIAGVSFAVFFLVGQVLIQYHFAPSVDYAKRLWWNLEYGRDNPKVEIKFFESEESAEKKYKNQLDYEKEHDFFNTVGNKK